MQLVAGVVASIALLASATPIDTNLPRSSTNNITSHVRNANHIFNALHSSMRQWGSAWHHNGMSFFLASVPAGTQFYHGTGSATRINGTEWLAFEPEHALNFAFRGGGGGRGRGRKGYPPGSLPPPPPDLVKGKHQEVIHDNDGNDDNEGQQWGYLHTYTTSKDLRLLYIDGLSGGKTDMGTMDSGDRIFLKDGTQAALAATGDDDKDPGGNHGSGPPGEYERALLGCEIAQNEWLGRIDGVLRTEAGFEIILCDFERDLKLERINAVDRQDDRDPSGFGNGGYFYRSIASRFDGIGGERVKVNYDNFLTAFAYDDLDLFEDGKNKMPRLSQFSDEELKPIRADLTALVMEHDTTEPLINWQKIVDMVVLKYSNLLKYLASDDVASLEDLQAAITNVFRAFIDARQRDASAEMERCATQFIPALFRPSHAQNSQPLASRVIYDVSYSICSTLRSALDETDLDVSKTYISNLIDHLAWTTWKECKTKCGYNEACYIPIWPFGTVEDRSNPQCKNGTIGFGGGGERYWRGEPGGIRPPSGVSHEGSEEL